MDSRLFMEIGMENTTFEAIDNSPYERWINDGQLDSGHSHAILQRLVAVVDGENNTLFATSCEIATTVDELRNPWEVQNIHNGLYYYQKLLLPTVSHAVDSNEILWYDLDHGVVKYYDEDSGEESTYNLWSDFDDIYEIVRKEYPDNCFYFDDYSFSIYSLVECYVLTEKDRISAYLSNNCKNNCETYKEIDYKSDILLAAINVLNDLMEKGDFFEAQRILNGLNTCGNLCKNYGQTLKGCGCGGA